MLSWQHYMTVWACTHVYTVTITGVPCCVVHMVELSHWIVEHLRENWTVRQNMILMFDNLIVKHLREK